MVVFPAKDHFMNPVFFAVRENVYLLQNEVISGKISV